MARLHSLFKDAPVLGSLINPRAQGGNLIEAEFHEMAPLLTAALASSETQKTKFENDAVELVVIAQGLAKAAELLAGQFTLVITNVPYLGRGKQDDVLQDYCERIHPRAKADLATCFVERCLDFCTNRAGSTALVTPQNWLFLTTYTKLRQILLQNRSWSAVVRLGPKGFQTPMWDFNVQLGIITAAPPTDGHTMAGIDVSAAKEPEEKAAMLRGDKPAEIVLVKQEEQLKNPDAILSFTVSNIKTYLRQYAGCYQGLTTADDGK
jgi:type I restriction-modification system DNA methylase subunit